LSNPYFTQQALGHQPAPVSPFVIRCFSRVDSPADFDLALALRLEVFVQEQSVPLEEERDAYDNEAVHWLVLKPDTLEAVATGRIVSYQEGCQMRPVAKIGRVAVKRAMRGQRLGELVMREIMKGVAEQGFDQAILDAQVQALPFYQKLGFVAEGEAFLDAGISHYRMRCLLSEGG
jgi:predicted GNAT family N-acyltransferase